MRDFSSMRTALHDRVCDWPDVEGLVWAGSAAEVDRADEWSDLDFFLIVRSGEQERFRRNHDWLPDAEGLAFVARETAHGCKALYADGFVLEYAVFDRDELSAAALNHFSVALGDADIEQRSAGIARGATYPSFAAPEDHLALASTLLVIGLGRHRRGEVLVAGQAIRSYAVGHLLAAAQELFTSEAPQVRDRLDAWRRVELEFPAFAADLAHAVAQDNEHAALALAAVATKWFSSASTVPGRGEAVLRQRFAR